jgi:hypothetical protein
MSSRFEAFTCRVAGRLTSGDRSIEDHFPGHDYWTKTTLQRRSFVLIFQLYVVRWIDFTLSPADDLMDLLAGGAPITYRPA